MLKGERFKETEVRGREGERSKLLSITSWHKFYFIALKIVTSSGHKVLIPRCRGVRINCNCKKQKKKSNYIDTENHEDFIVIKIH